MLVMRQRRTALEHHGARFDIRCRHFADKCVGRGRRAVAANAIVRPRATSKTHARDARHRPISVKELSLNLPASTWRKVTWREGVAAPLSSRFARVRVRVAHRDYKLTEPYPE